MAQWLMITWKGLEIVCYIRRWKFVFNVDPFRVFLFATMARLRDDSITDVLFLL